ncbi:MAG TPA: tetratricopeptide repeat protein [Vicinamibacteria bacterium]|nr:tetratricopeptide repeat protein [Vicinamibacteria bacterium]
MALAVGTVVLFGVTSLAARRYHALEERLAQEWRATADRAMVEGRPAAAIEAYRNALVHSRDDHRLRLRLAEALVAAGLVDEARSHLLTLWEREPGSAAVNRELARLAAREGDVGEARRYYHGAVYGVWEEDPEKGRREVRLELCELLVRRGANVDAQSELIALAATLPRESELRVRVADLMLRAGDPARALEQLREALARSPSHPHALAQAGRVSLQLRDYRAAERYLRRAASVRPGDASVRELLGLAVDVLAVDPFTRRLPSRERGRRAERAFQQAAARLEGCRSRPASLPGAEGTADLDALLEQSRDLATQVRKGRLRRDPDLVEAAMDLVFQIERATASACGAPAGLDAALLLLAGEAARAE